MTEAAYRESETVFQSGSKVGSSEFEIPRPACRCALDRLVLLPDTQKKRRMAPSFQKSASVSATLAPTPSGAASLGRGKCNETKGFSIATRVPPRCKESNRRDAKMWPEVISAADDAIRHPALLAPIPKAKSCLAPERPSASKSPWRSAPGVALGCARSRSVLPRSPDRN